MDDPFRGAHRWASLVWASGTPKPLGHPIQPFPHTRANPRTAIAASPPLAATPSSIAGCPPAASPSATSLPRPSFRAAGLTKSRRPRRRGWLTRPRLHLPPQLPGAVRPASVLPSSSGDGSISNGCCCELHLPQRCSPPPGRRQGTMKAGRKNLKRVSHGEEGLSLQDGQSIMQVISLRGSNIIEVVDAKGVKSLALFPAKFQKSLWIKRGSFVVVDENGRKEALDSGNKVACMVSQVLFHEQVRVLQKCSQWPETFRTTIVDDSCSYEKKPAPQCNAMSDSDEGDGLPPLEANLNRSRPVELYSDSDTDSDANTDHGECPG